jgi:hypothetical protein
MKICPKNGVEYDHTPEEWRKLNGGIAAWGASGAVRSASVRRSQPRDQESQPEPPESQPDAEGQQDSSPTQS